MRHTEGPWMHGHPEDTKPFPSIPVYGGDGPEVARVFGNGKGASTANARLIVEAPALAEVAQLAYTFMGNIKSNDTLTEYEQAIHDKSEAALVAIYGRENVSY